MGDSLQSFGQGFSQTMGNLKQGFGSLTPADWMMITGQALGPMRFHVGPRFGGSNIYPFMPLMLAGPLMAAREQEQRSLGMREQEANRIMSAFPGQQGQQLSEYFRATGGLPANIFAQPKQTRGWVPQTMEEAIALRSAGREPPTPHLSAEQLQEREARRASLEESRIAEQHRHNLAMESRSAKAPSAPEEKPPKGYIFDIDESGAISRTPEGRPKLIRQGQMGQLLEIATQRLVGNAADASQRIDLLWNAPFETGGIFGTRIGEHGHDGLFSPAVKDYLANSLTTESAQRFQALQAGIARNVAVAEAGGKNVTEGFVKQLVRGDGVIPGDTIKTAQLKIASMAGYLRNHMHAMNLKKMAPEQRELVESVLKDLDRIPSIKELQTEYYRGSKEPTLGSQEEAGKVSTSKSSTEKEDPLVMDGHRFPSIEKLEDYKKAKAEAVE